MSISHTGSDFLSNIKAGGNENFSECFIKCDKHYVCVCVGISSAPRRFLPNLSTRNNIWKRA